MNATRIGPSLLAADFARLAEDIGRVERGGADFLHLDVMDGHFVPNISFGLPVVAAVRQTTRLELNTHLMLQDPLPFIGPFKEAGADSLVVHVELESAQAVLDAIRQHGLQCGLAVNPKTPVSALYPISTISIRPWSCPWSRDLAAKPSSPPLSTKSATCARKSSAVG